MLYPPHLVFNEIYLVEVNIILGIDFTNKNFFNLDKF